jgi:Fur family transcriptional regulator, ferric uptake regulator
MKAVEILKCYGIRKTPGRLAIVKILQEKNRPLSEAELKHEMDKDYDRITFYRNILKLQMLGVVHKIVIDNTVVKYGLISSEDGLKHKNEHAHFYCEECHSVVCLDEVKIPDISLPSGYKYNDCDIIIKGRCEKCNH